jgi:hypothetical protein
MWDVCLYNLENIPNVRVYTFIYYFRCTTTKNLPRLVVLQGIKPVISQSVTDL